MSINCELLLRREQIVNGVSLGTIANVMIELAERSVSSSFLLQESSTRSGLDVARQNFEERCLASTIQAQESETDSLADSERHAINRSMRFGEP